MCVVATSASKTSSSGNAAGRSSGAVMVVRAAGRRMADFALFSFFFFFFFSFSARPFAALAHSHQHSQCSSSHWAVAVRPYPSSPAARDAVHRSPDRARSRTFFLVPLFRSPLSSASIICSLTATGGHGDAGTTSSMVSGQRRGEGSAVTAVQGEGRTGGCALRVHHARLTGRPLAAAA